MSSANAVISSLRVALSYGDLAFSFLNESHTIVSQALSSVVLDALKSKNPNDWKKKICDGFTDRTRLHLERSFDSDQLTDVYVICKILQRFIHDVAKFCGGFEDSAEKERLSLQTQGIETGRNWAFHGKLMSSGEVFMSISLSLVILTKLKCQPAFIQRLLKLQDDARRLVTSHSDREDSKQYLISANSLKRTLLYSSFTSFQKLFQNFFQNMTDKQQSSKLQKAAMTQQSDIPSLVKRIRKELHKPKKESLLVMADGNSAKKTDKRSLLGSLDNIILMRNKLAHNELLSLTEINKILGDVFDVLSAFGLVSEETKLAIGQLAVIQQDGNTNENALVYSVLQRSKKEKSPDQWQHVLRPQGHFIGRTEHLKFISNFMCDTSHNYESTGLLICGPAGIGKSYLATKCTSDLRETYPWQAWLSCSSVEAFQQDLATHPHSLFQTVSEWHAWNACNKNFGISGAKRPEGRWLIVLDDLCSATVRHAYKNVVCSHNSFIITTRSTAVKEFLLRMVPQLRVIELQPFSTTESWQLIMKKMERSTINELSLTFLNNALSGVLGNLPLCISIYSSLMVSVSKRKSDRQHLALDGDLLLVKWRQVEEQFGDRLHVRGLTGVVDSTRKYLKDHPFAVFLLAKICSTSSERILWNVLRKGGPTAPMNGYKQFRNDHGEHDLCVNLLGVMDYLFSESGQEILETCRDDLEELGLISWNNESLTVKIHRLTLHTTQRLLEENAHFLHQLAANVIGKSIEGSCEQTTSKWLSEILTGELLLQVFSRTIELIAEKSNENGQCEDNREELLFGLVLFLKTLTSSYQCQRIIEKLLNPQTVTHVLSTSHITTFHCRSDLNIDMIGFFDLSMLALYRSQSPCYKTKVLKVGYAVEQGMQLENMGLLEEALVCYKTAQAEGKGIGDTRALFLMFMVHSSIAHVLHQLQGLTASNKYLVEAMETCPLLKSCLTKKRIQNLLIHLENSSSFERSAETIFTELFTLHTLTCLKLDGLLINGEDRETLLQCARLLTVAIQEVQTKMIWQLQQHMPLTITCHAKMKELCYLQSLMSISADRFLLDISLDRFSASLPMMMKILSVLEEKLPQFALLPLNKTELRDVWLNLASFVDNLREMAYNVGLLKLAAKVSHCLVTIWDKVLRGCNKCFNCINFPGILQCDSLEMSTEKLQCDEFDYSSISVGNGEQVENQLNAFFFDSIWALHDKLCFQQSLTNFMTVLKIYAFLNCKAPELSSLAGCRFRGNETLVLRMCFCLCILLGREVALQFVRSLTSLADNEMTQPALRKDLQETVKKLRLLPPNSPWHSLYTCFAEARTAFERDLLTRMGCCKASLAYWKELARLEVNSSQGLTIDELRVIHVILHRLLLQTAEYLWKIYLDEKNFVAAEWFLKFCGRFSKRKRCFLDSAKYGVEYIEFLKEQKRWSEALQQCHLVEEGLVKHFSGEYSTWLPEAPDTSHLLQSMEEKIRKERE